ncbi:MAG TPA: NAD(P)/FAD-dependent oxidoreductase [Firmicutes bacterium]|nr:NAD(P)/FAD-dependent oxidoreductase [Bacillota bacterium]
MIGAGIAGLSTGCYAQMNNYQSEIYEMHSTPGGVCTSWKRGDYLFDHCLHWVIGSNRETSLYPIFKELGIADSIDFFYTDKFRVISLNDRTILFIPISICLRLNYCVYFLKRKRDQEIHQPSKKIY